MNYLRERVLEPIIIPLVSVALIAFGALNLSRLFLASASADRAVIVATAISAAILAGAAWATSRDHIDRGVLLGGAALVGLVLSGAGLLAAQVDRDHTSGGHGPTDVVSHLTFTATNFAFDPAEQTVAGPGIEIGLALAEGSHTLVIEGHPEAKLAVDGEKKVVSLEPGDYLFFCDIPGHQAQGMEGTLTVTEGGGEGDHEAGGAGAAGGSSVTVEAVKGFAFSSDAYEAPAGEVALEYDNTDTLPHTLVVEGHEDEMRIEAAGGEKGTGSLKLDPGAYVLYCDIPGHRGQGMEAAFTVT